MHLTSYSMTLPATNFNSLLTVSAATAAAVLAVLFCFLQASAYHLTSYVGAVSAGAASRNW
jgi:hypothetical protein